MTDEKALVTLILGEGLLSEIIDLLGGEESVFLGREISVFIGEGSLFNSTPKCMLSELIFYIPSTMSSSVFFFLNFNGF